jgi:hypothetical protein
MQTDTQYLSALFPDEYRVLGIRMAPYTLGHAMLLERLGSPFVTGAHLPGRGDLKLAIALCRRSYPRALARVRRTLGIGNWSFVLERPWLLDQETQLSGIAQLTDYIRAFQHRPATWNERPGGREMGTPFLLAVKLTQVMHLGKTDLQALCTPLSAALWEYACCWELQEKMQVVNPAERLAQAAVDALKSRAKPVNGNPQPASDNPQGSNGRRV